MNSGLYAKAKSTSFKDYFARSSLSGLDLGKLALGRRGQSLLGLGGLELGVFWGLSVEDNLGLLKVSAGV